MLPITSIVDIGKWPLFFNSLFHRILRGVLIAVAGLSMAVVATIFSIIVAAVFI
jgi:uncharacterized membrane protein